MRYIDCTVNQEYVIGAGVVVGAAGSHDSTALRLKFSEEWDGLSIYVSWKDSLGESTSFSLLSADMVDAEGNYVVPIPAAPLQYEGQMMMTLVGYELADGVETSMNVSAVAYFKVLQSEYESLEDGSITPTVAQELQSALDGKVDKVEGKELSSNDLTDTILTDINANTDARHGHSNKYLLDGITSTGLEIADAVAKKHLHTNKDLLDSYTQTEVNLADAVAKKHEHANIDILDDIDDEKVSIWDKAEILADRYAVVDYLGNDTTTIPSSIAIVRALEVAGAGDMLKIMYDTTGTGNKVDTSLNSEKLNGQTAVEIITEHNEDPDAHSGLVADKLDKVSTTGEDRAYIVDAEGNQGVMVIGSGSNEIVKRANNGQITTPTPSAASDATNKLYVDTLMTLKQNIMHQTSIELTAAQWTEHTQTVNVSGLLSTHFVIVSPATRDDLAAWGDSEIVCLDNTENGSLTFECTSDPTGTVTVNIVWG